MLVQSKNRCVYSKREKDSVASFFLFDISPNISRLCFFVSSKFSTMENFLLRRRIFNDVNISRWCEFIFGRQESSRIEIKNSSAGEGKFKFRAL